MLPRLIAERSTTLSWFAPRTNVNRERLLFLRRPSKAVETVRQSPCIFMIAYLNGNFVPLEQASIPVWDYGFTMGVAISEQIRTFAGKLPMLDWHLERLFNGLSVTGIDAGLSRPQINEIVFDVAQKNFREISAGQDLGIGVAITPGGQPSRVPSSLTTLDSATVLIYAMPLAFATWANDYVAGIRLSTVDIREVPDQCVPRELKCRSRMHYFLAEKEASKKSPGSRALLLDMNGHVAEGTTASLLIVKDGSIVAPKRDDVLPSVSVRYLESVLCPQLGVDFQRADLSVDDLHRADELLWLSTSACVLPVAELDGVGVAQFADKPVFAQIMAAWSANVGCDVIKQANTNSS